VTAKKNNPDVVAHQRVASPAPVYQAGRRIETASGTVLAGERVDVSHWPPNAIRASLAVGELVIPIASGRTRYIVAPGRRLRVGDRWLGAGEPVPDDTWRSSRGADCYLSSGDVVPNPAANTSS
jgi:hypothetical protein